MQGYGTRRLHLALGLAASVLLAACGDNLRGNAPGGRDPAVALDRNIVTGPMADIAGCGRYPSRC